MICSDNCKDSVYFVLVSSRNKTFWLENFHARCLSTRIKTQYKQTNCVILMYKVFFFRTNGTKNDINRVPVSINIYWNTCTFIIDFPKTDFGYLFEIYLKHGKRVQACKTFKRTVIFYREENRRFMNYFKSSERRCSKSIENK